MLAAISLLGVAVAALVLALVWLLVRQGAGRDGTEVKLAIKGLETRVVEATGDVKGRFQQDLGQLLAKVQELETRLAQSTGEVRERVLQGVYRLQEHVVAMQTALNERRALENEIRETTARIAAVITGAGKGRAGENILGEILRSMPPSMIESDLRVRGKPVEFALVLPNNKRLPLDSKFAASEVLERLAQEPDGQQQAALKAELERAVLLQADRVSSYIDHGTTMPFALMALPDPAFAHISTDVISRAYRKGVHIISYSMAPAFLLSFYTLCLQYASQIDPASLNAGLERVLRDCQAIRTTLENKVARADTMLTNAYGEMVAQVQDIEEAVHKLRVAAQPAAPGSLTQGDGSTS